MSLINLRNFLVKIKRLGFIELQDKAEIEEGKNHPTCKKSNLKLDHIFFSKSLDKYINSNNDQSIDNLYNVKYLEKVSSYLDHIGIKFTMKENWFF